MDMPCRYCESFNSIRNTWSLDGGEVSAIECNSCNAAATEVVWNQPVSYRGCEIKMTDHPTLSLPLTWRDLNVDHQQANPTLFTMQECREAIDDYLTQKI